MLLTLALLFPLMAAPPAATAQPASVSTQPTKMGESATVHRGAPFELTTELTLEQIMAKPETYAQTPVRIKGIVKKVCLKKGCWLVLAGTSPTARARVTFKGYAFFAPMDSAGHTASVEGLVQSKTLSEGERAHLAEDGKVSIDQIPKHEIRIVATAAAFTKP